MPVLFMSILLQLMVRNGVLLMEFAGHVVLRLFSSEMYMVLAVQCTNLQIILIWPIASIQPPTKLVSAIVLP